jgi:hypothetical protein
MAFDTLFQPGRVGEEGSSHELLLFITRGNAIGPLFHLFGPVFAVTVGCPKVGYHLL